MALNTDPLARALGAARAEEPAGWPPVPDAVMRRVRAVVTPAYDVLVDEAPDGSRTLVSTRVVTAALRVALSQDPTYAPSGIRLHLTDDRLDRVELALVAAYDVDLRVLAGRARAVVVSELSALVEGASLTPGAVDVDVVDVVVGDPRVV